MLDVESTGNKSVLCRRRELLTQVKYRAVLPQLLLQVRDGDILHRRVTAHSECRSHARSLSDDHVLRLHAHRGVRRVASREADRHQQVLRF